MPKVLTINSTIQCGHGGKVVITSSAKLKINGYPVLVKDNVDGKPMTGCETTFASDSSGPTDIPCSSVSLVPSEPGVVGEATKLKVGGQFVLLDTLVGKTDGMVKKTTPQTLLPAVANQSTLKAI